MVVSITVLYPKTSDSKFDLDYYKTSHMPMVEKEFKPYGFKGYRVVSFSSAGDGSAPPYSTQCSLDFDSVDDFKTAMDKTGPTVLGDIKNFSNVDPLLIVGDEVLVQKL